MIWNWKCLGFCSGWFFLKKTAQSVVTKMISVAKPNPYFTLCLTRGVELFSQHPLVDISWLISAELNMGSLEAKRWIASLAAITTVFSLYIYLAYGTFGCVKFVRRRVKCGKRRAPGFIKACPATMDHRIYRQSDRPVWPHRHGRTESQIVA